MWAEEIKVLLVDDDEDDFILTKELLRNSRNSNYILKWSSSAKGAEKLLTQENFDVYLIDYLLGDQSGIELLNELKMKGDQTPVIMLTGQSGFDTDIEAMKAGASDYLVKGKTDAASLEKAIRYTVEKARNTAKLLEQEKKYRLLFENSPYGIFICTPDHVMIASNPEMQSLFGYDEEEFLYMNLKKIMLREKEFNSFTKKIMENEPVKDFEAVMKKKSGDEINCLLSASSLSIENDQPISSYQGFIRDITEKKRAEKELFHAEKLTMTGRIARSIAHEVRNPLTNIDLALDQLKTELPLDSSTEYFVEIIRRNSQRINVLITELLDSAKPSRLQLDQVKINQLLERTLSLLNERVQLQDVDVVRDFSQDIPEIQGDPKKLLTAFLNIIVNALEVLSSGEGKLKISTRADEEYIIIDIIDNGPGISEDVANKIFEPFFTSKKNGMGLGLTTANNIIQAHKGRIELKDTSGKGTHFRIVLRH